MKVVFNDGGRKAAGYRGEAGDCVCRAIAIATGRPYREVYDRLAQGNADQRITKKQRRGQSKRAHGVRTAAYGIGIKRQWFKDYMAELGFTWITAMQIGSGCRVHLRAGELPPGRLVVRLSKHLCAVIDGVVYDTHDPRRGETRCVYGYWRLDT